jgi:hypothetical protein
MRGAGSVRACVSAALAMAAAKWQGQEKAAAKVCIKRNIKVWCQDVHAHRSCGAAGVEGAPAEHVPAVMVMQLSDPYAVAHSNRRQAVAVCSECKGCSLR